MVHRSNLEPIHTLKHLSIFLGIPLNVIKQLADSAPKHYSPYLKSKKNGGFRTIDNPSKELKAVQKRIKKRMLEPHPLPKEILGGVKGFGIKDYAKIHVGQSEVICLDIKNCFPSVKYKEVFRVYRENFSYSMEVASVLTKLTTFRGRLPQGAPTSNDLLNIAISPLCEEVAELCNAHGLRVSFWVDDITISGENASSIIQEVVLSVHKHHFAVKSQKTKIMSRLYRQSALGLTVNSKVSVSNKKYNEYISDIYNLSSEDQIAGRSIYLEYINKNQARRFLRFTKKRLEDRK